MTLDVLIFAGLAAILLSGVVGFVCGVRRRWRALGWSAAALLLAVTVNYPIIAAASAQDLEAGPVGVIVVGSAAVIALALITLGAFIGEIAMIVRRNKASN